MTPAPGNVTATSAAGEAPAEAVARYEVPSADGTPIPVYKSGAGRPLVLVHGARGPHTVWEGVRPFLAAHATVLAMDRRNTFVDPSVRYDLQREFEDVAAVAAWAGGEVDVLGQSSGAVCALGAALLIPGLRRLVLYEPPFVAALPSNLERLEELLRAGDAAAAAEAFLRHSVKLSPAAIEAMKAGPEWPQIVARAPFMLREEAVVRAWQPAAEAFRGLGAPVLYLVGEKTPAGHHHRLYIDFLRSAGVDLTVWELPGQEHAAHQEAPELFARLVRDFLEER